MNNTQDETIQAILSLAKEALVNGIDKAEQSARDAFVEDEKQSCPTVKMTIAISYTLQLDSDLKVTLKFTSSYKDEHETTINHNQQKLF
jgi:hypothetical protein